MRFAAASQQNWRIAPSYPKTPLCGVFCLYGSCLQTASRLRDAREELRAREDFLDAEQRKALAGRFGFSVAQDAPVTAGVSDGRAQGSITLRHEGLGATVTVKVDNTRGDNPNAGRLRLNRAGEIAIAFDDGRAQTIPLDAGFFSATSFHRAQHPGNFLSALAEGVETLTARHLDAQQQGVAQGAQVQQQGGGQTEGGQQSRTIDATTAEVRAWNGMLPIARRAIGRAAGLHGKQLDDLQRAGEWKNIDADTRAKLLQAWRENPDAGSEFDVPAAQVPNRTQPDEDAAAILRGEPVYHLDVNIDVPQGGIKRIIAAIGRIFARKNYEATHDSIGTVELDERAARKSLSHGMGEFKLAAFSAMPEVIKRGALVTHARHSNVNSYYIAAPVTITNEEGASVDCVVTVLVHHDNNVQRVYLHRVDTKESLLQRGNLGADGDKSPWQSRTSAARGNASVAQGIHQGKVSADEVRARLHDLLTMNTGGAVVAENATAQTDAASGDVSSAVADEQSGNSGRLQAGGEGLQAGGEGLQSGGERLQAGAEGLQAAPSAPDGWVGLTPAQAAAEWDGMTAPERVEALDGTLLRSEGVELGKRYDMANQPFAQLTPEMQRRVAAHLTLQHEKGKRNGALVKQLLAQRSGRPLPETRGQTEQQTEEASNGRYEAAAQNGRDAGNGTGDSGASHAQDARAHDDGDVRDESAVQLRTDADSAAAAAGVHEREDGAGVSDGEGGARAGNAKRREGNPRDAAHSPQTGHDANPAGGTGAADARTDAGNSAAAGAAGLAATADDAGGVAQDARQQHANERESGRTVLDFAAWQKARTPQFKAWFGGDWEVLHDLTVPEAVTEEYARERLAELAGRDLRNDDTEFVGRINRKQADKILSPLARDKSIANLKYEMDAAEAVARHYALAARMEQLWKHAVYVGEFEDKNEKDKNGKKTGTQGVKIHRFAVAVRQGGEVRLATILAKEDAANSAGQPRVYTLELHEEKALQETMESWSEDSEPASLSRSAKEILRATEEKINPPFLNLTNPITGEPWAEIAAAKDYQGAPADLLDNARDGLTETVRDTLAKLAANEELQRAFRKGDEHAARLWNETRVYIRAVNFSIEREDGSVREDALLEMRSQGTQEMMFAPALASSPARNSRIKTQRLWQSKGKDAPQKRAALWRESGIFGDAQREAKRAWDELSDDARAELSLAYERLQAKKRETDKGVAQGANLNQAEAVKKGNGQNLNQEAGEDARTPEERHAEKVLVTHTPTQEEVRARDALVAMEAVDVGHDPDLYQDDLKAAIARARNVYQLLVDATQERGFGVLTKDGRRIKFTNRNFKEVSGHSGDRRVLETLANLENLFQHAVPLYSSSAMLKGRQQAKAFHFYGVKARFKEGDAYVLLEVLERDNGEFFYDANATSVEFVFAENEDVAAVPLAGRLQPVAGNKQRHPSRGRLSQWMDAVNKIAPAPAAEQKKANIEDFGEKLEGARKDLARAQKELARDLGLDEIASLPLTKLFPASAVDAIEDVQMAALAKAMRDSIPRKPRDEFEKKRWAKDVQTVRSLAQDLLADVGADEMHARLLAGDSAGLQEISDKARLLESVPRDQWGRIGNVYSRRHYTPDGYNIPDGTATVEIDGARKNFPKEELAEGVNRYLGESAPKEKAGLQFEIRYLPKQGVVFVMKKGDTGYHHLKEFHYDKDGGRNALNHAVNEVHAFMREHADELTAEWEKVKARENVRKEDVRGAENRDRTGKDWRKGKDATKEMFTEAFGFRGVEFGNWVGQGKGAKERQGLLNQAYDALQDLADILGIDSRAISLNGSLGLSFGARGNGGQFAAKFQPGVLVIALTKNRGAGTLAHEWFHALDNYFSSLRGEAHRRSGKDEGREGIYITYKPEPVFVRRDRQNMIGVTRAWLEQRRKLNPQNDYYAEENWIPDPRHPQGVRPEVERNFAALVEALDASPMAARAKTADKGKSGYWSRIIERGARAFENYVVHKLEQRGQSNDYLANIRPADEFVRNDESYPYLLKSELAPIEQAFDRLFGEMKQRETDKGVALFSRSQDAPAFRRAEPVQGTAQTFAQWKREIDTGETDLRYPDWLKHGGSAAGVTQADAEAVRALNAAMVRYGLGKDWSNAYEAVELPDALSGIREAVQAAFGRDIRAVAPTAAEYDTFNGVYLPKRPGEVFVNVRSNVGFAQVAGHELLHELKRTAPELYEWFKQHAEQYLTNVEGYRTRLNRLLQAGERPYGTELAKEELLGDFTGDAMADPQFLAQLAEDDGNRFRQLLRTVTRWLDTVWGKLRGFDSHEHVQDVEALRKHLKNVLLAWSNGKGVDFIARMEKLDLAREHLRAAGIDWKQPDSARGTAAGTNRGQNVPSGAGGKMMFSRKEAAAYGATPEALQAEYDAVVARYKGTAQWMKAPNGKPTKLTERQWVQVRTPRFKAWFGNWELKHKDFAIVEAQAAPFNNYKDALQWARDNGILGEMTNEETGGKGRMNISAGSVHEMLNPGQRSKSTAIAAHYAALTKIKEIIRESELADVHPDYRKGADGKRSPRNGINEGVRIEVLYGAMQHEGRVYRVKTTIKRYADGNKVSKANAYHVEGVEIEGLAGKGRGSDANASTPSTSPSEGLAGTLVGDANASNPNTSPSETRTEGNRVSATILLRGVRQVNQQTGEPGTLALVGHSAVMDENGEPLVVYHGTNHAGFTVFGRDDGSLANGKTEGAHWFASSRRMAAAYTTKADLDAVEDARLGEAEHSAVYPVFLNLRRPVLDDFEGARWTGDHKGERAMLVLPDGTRITPEGRSYFESEAEAEQYARAHNIREYSIRNAKLGRSTDSVAAAAKEAGRDGVIVRNVRDGLRTPETVFVAFDSTQIKSATANTGAFGIDEGDVRFSRAGEPVGNSDGLGEKQGIWHQYDGEDYTPKRVALSEAQQRAVLGAVNKARANAGENPLANMDEVSRLTDIQELAAGFAALAESEGWTVPEDVGTSHHARANRYFTITRGDFDGDDYVEMSVRVSDHARTSSQHTRETDINLVPSARAVGDDYEWAYDTFESALYKLQNATGDEFGEAMLDGEPMMRFSRNRSQATAGLNARKAARLERERFFGGRSVEQLMRDYDALPEADGGHVINADIARTLSPQYRDGSASADDVQNAASELADRLFKRDTARPVAAGREALVVFTAGGSGAGKSAAVAKLITTAQKADIVFDGTFSDADRAVARVKRALASGRDVEVCFVYRTPANAAASVIKRANENRRTVPLATLVKSHTQSLQTVRQVLRECADAVNQGRLRVTAIDNNGAHIEDARVFESLDQVPEETQDAVREQFKQALDAARAAWADSDADRVQRAGSQEPQDGKPDERRTGTTGRIPRDESATIPASSQGRRARESADTVSNTLSPALYNEFMQGEQDTPSFSRAAAASFGTITPEQEAALRATGLLRQPKTIKERFRELTDNLGKRLVQGIVDQYAPLKELDFRSYVLARMSKGTDGTFEAMLHYGTPRVNGDTVEVDTSTGGLMGVLSELSGEQDRFLAWIAANRAEQLTKEGREFLFTPEQIQHLKALNQGTMKDGRDRATAYGETLQKFNDFQDAVLAIAEARGLIDAVTDTGTPVIIGYEIGAGGNGAAFPSSPSLQSAPLMRKEQIVAALKERIAQLEAQVNGTDSVEAVEFNEKFPAAIWVDSTVQSDGIDPTSIRSTGDVFSLAQRVENFNASNMRAVLDPQTKEPVAGVVERFQKERGEDAPQFSRAAAASFGTITPEQEAGFFPPRHKTPLRGVFCWVPCAGNSGGKCALFAGRRAVGGGDNVGQWCACRGVAAGREDGRLRGERRWPRKATPRRQNSQPVSGLQTHGQMVTCRCRGSLRPFSS